MKIVQVRFGIGYGMDDYGHPSESRPSDRFMPEEEAADTIRVYGSAKIVNEKEVDIVRADEFDPDAPPFRWDAFERAAILRMARPKGEPRGYPRTKVTILVNGEPHNVEFKIMPATDPYDWPVWAIVQAACDMFKSPKAGIGQLKAAVRAYEQK